jgi:hypothetical protein
MGLVSSCTGTLQSSSCVRSTLVSVQYICTSISNAVPPLPPSMMLLVVLFLYASTWHLLVLYHTCKAHLAIGQIPNKTNDHGNSSAVETGAADSTPSQATPHYDSAYVCCCGKYLFLSRQHYGNAQWHESRSRPLRSRQRRVEIGSRSIESRYVYSDSDCFSVSLSI